MSQEYLSFSSTYEIKGEIGKGGGGTVYLAYHKRLQKDVVLKKIHGKLTSINARNETDILKNLKSAYLPQVIDFIEEDGNVYTVMEYIEGHSFEQLLKEGYRFKEQDVVKWYRQLAEALMILHEQNPPIIHGDIKPANIMLTSEGDICLIDFNVSSVFDGKYDQMVGYTPAYAAPEQIAYYRAAMQAASVAQSEVTESYIDVKTDVPEGERRVQPMGNSTGLRAEAMFQMQAAIDPRADLYSLAATMYHVITGARPKTQEGNITDIRKQCKEITEPLAFLVMKDLNEDPTKRMSSARKLMEALTDLYQSTAVYKGLLIRQRMVRIVLLAGTIGFVLLTGLGVRMMRQEREMAYNDVVEQEARAREAMDAEALENAFSEAIVLSQSRSDAYIEKGWYLYETGEYEEGLHFLLDEAIPFVTDSKGKSNLYLLAGMDYYELEDYKNAHAMFEDALVENEENAKAYQEDAIVLAKTGKLPEAEARLEKAVEQGLSDDGIAYTSGEIAYAKKEYDEAERCLKKAIETTDDPYLMMRAYLMLADIYEKMNRSLDESIAFLEKAKEGVAVQYRLPIIQALAQAYIDRYDESERTEDADEAAMLLQGLLDNGYGNFTTYETMVVLYQKTGSFEKEEALLKEMEERFGEDYRIYMYRTYMDVLKQNELSNEVRNYQQFKADYSKAKQLYDNRKDPNKTDPMMSNLEEVNREVKSGGW